MLAMVGLHQDQGNVKLDCVNNYTINYKYSFLRKQKVIKT